MYLTMARILRFGPIIIRLYMIQYANIIIDIKMEVITSLLESDNTDVL